MSPAEKDVIWELWEPKDGDYINHNDEIIILGNGAIEDNEEANIDIIYKYCNNKVNHNISYDIEDCLPLFSIGQMIDILHKNFKYDVIIDSSDDDEKWKAKIISNRHEQEFMAMELCDALWEAVESQL